MPFLPGRLGREAPGYTRSDAGLIDLAHAYDYDGAGMMMPVVPVPVRWCSAGHTCNCGKRDQGQEQR
jgi:hypothetical protein